jgi:hypothetical protein
MITGLADFTWGEVEVVDYVEDPTSFPWNAGPDYPFRVGYHVDMITKDGGVTLRNGMFWLDAEGHDPVAGVRRIGFTANRSASQ